ncbi:MAG: hypothetical protein GAK41_00357 [Burkholderia gladioli]|nr:MAG: hypothetical protein GAK41_00357 [Burkholderia gladioli]
MTKSKAGRKGQEFSLEFRQQTLLRAATEGVTTVARDLGLQTAQRSYCRIWCTAVATGI